MTNRKWLLLIGIGIISFNLSAQDEAPPFVRESVRAVETMLFQQGDASIEHFMIQFMPAIKPAERSAWQTHIKNIRNKVSALRDNVSVEPSDKGFLLSFSANGVERVVAVTLDVEKKQITAIQLEAPPEPIILTNENLRSVFEQLEKEGFAGLVHIKKKGTVLIQHTFGMANELLKTKNNEQTVFGIGSRPIDFTIAAVYLLDQQGKLKLADPVSKYFKNIPADKQAIHIEHLLTGQSGLPDFFHTDDDRDPDLQWINRDEAVQRIMNQQLLFTPGTAREHSHAAFVLLAALIDKVSGMSYYEYIRKYFLDPAGMNRTGEYGESRGLSITDFAAGGGPMFFGLPNIPPNWGKTSWLIKGSGGMYSTLGNLQQFYNYVRSGKVLDEEHSKVFKRNAINLDGSDRGFELFSSFHTNGDESWLFLNKLSSRRKFRTLLNALEKFVME